MKGHPVETSTKLWIIGIGVLLIVVGASIVIKKIRRNERMRSLSQYAEPGYDQPEEVVTTPVRQRTTHRHEERPLMERELGVDGRRRPRRHHADEDDTATPPHGLPLSNQWTVDDEYPQRQYTGLEIDFGSGHGQPERPPVETMETGFERSGNLPSYTPHVGGGNEGFRSPDAGYAGGTVSGGHSMPQQAAAPDLGSGSQNNYQSTD